MIWGDGILSGYEHTSSIIYEFHYLQCLSERTSYFNATNDFQFGLICQAIDTLYQKYKELF